MVAVLALCLAGLTAVGIQVRCLDAAREAARLAARGDHHSATETAREIAPDGATIAVDRDGPLVVARVSARSILLPGVTIGARAVSAAEPGLG